IPHWNLKDDLLECLHSLQRTTYAHHQVVVVDNGSTNGSPELLEREYPWVQLIRLPENRGYSGAVNAGIEYALAVEADFVFVLNNDTVVPPDTIGSLVDAFSGDPAIGIVAPKILYYDRPDRVFSLGDRSYRLLPMPRGFGYTQRDRPDFAGIMEFDYVPACAMLIRTDLFHHVGFFDVTYFMYYEDADFCRRARDRGYRVLCQADAVIYHKASLSADKNKTVISRVRARNRVRFYRQYRHGPHPWCTYLCLG